jgi:hypothetical protein
MPVWMNLKITNWNSTDCCRKQMLKQKKPRKQKGLENQKKLLKLVRCGMKQKLLRVRLW